MSPSVGKKFRTVTGTVVEIFSTTPRHGYLVGSYVDGGVERIMQYDTTGCAIGRSTGDLDLANEVTPGDEQWDRLDSYQKESVKILVVAFLKKKISGIKYLRGAHGWGLLEAKNIFEGVADGRLF